MAAPRAASDSSPARPGVLFRRHPATPSAPAPGPYADRPWLAAYPPGVPHFVDFPTVPLTALLDDAAAAFPETVALAFQGTSLTYRELTAAVDRFATGLAALGVRKGDRVAIVLPNCPQNVITLFAALRLGAVAVEHNPLYTPDELRHQLADSGATVVVCLDGVLASVAEIAAQTSLRHVVVATLLDYLPRIDRMKLRLPFTSHRRARPALVRPIAGLTLNRFSALMKQAKEPTRQAELDPERDLALLQYTGGTTGRSKGAMLSHANLVSNACMLRAWDTEAVRGKEVTLAVLPLFHAYGLTVAMTATMAVAGTLVLLPRFDLDEVFAAMDRWHPTMLPGVPPIFQALSDSPKSKQHDLRSLRICVSGAMKLPTEVKARFERICGARLVEGYGLTETSPSTHCNPFTGDRRPGSIGVPLPGTDAKIVDREDARQEVPPGEPGELAVRGPQVFSGYWNATETAGMFTDDGYLLTGDIAVMDDDGFFRIVDRKKELIIAGGFNIYPSEVEDVLAGLPGVAEAVVIGVPDRHRGETVKAFVVPRPGAALSAEEVTRHCAASLAAYKVPRVVEFRESLPRTPVGKVLRRVLVDEERTRGTGGVAPAPTSFPGGRP